MKGSLVQLGALLLATGCIPAADPPPGYRAADAAPRPWRYARPAPPPAPADAAPVDTGPPIRDAPPSMRDEPAASSESLPVSTRDARSLDQATPEPYSPERPRPSPRQPVRAPAPPAPPSTWEARPIAPDAQVVPQGSVTVRPGDTLGAVAARTGAGAAAIARANDLAPPYALREGRRLTITGGRYHLVRPGQSGIAIARAYGVPWSRIVDANALPEPYTLRAGDRILIPGAPGRPSSAAERAAAFRLDVDDILTGGEPALPANATPAPPVARPRRALAATAAIGAPARLTGGFDWPADGRVLKRFGRGGGEERPDGVEIAAAAGEPIRAAADGVVAYAGDAVKALGGLVIVRHGEGWSSVYGHAERLLVQRGQAVKRGQTIALAGDTGDARRPEVHFELRRGRTPVDPATELPAR